MVRALRVINTPDTHREQPPDLRDRVAAAVDSMTWLSDSDSALVALAKRQADEIETAIERAQMLSDLYVEAAGDRSVYDKLKRLEAYCEVAKVVATIGPQLQASLKELGGTPAARALLKKDKPAGSRLEQIRQAAGNAATRVDEA